MTYFSTWERGNTWGPSSMPWNVHQSLHQTNQHIKHLAFNVDHALYTLEPTTYVGI
jgi:hypothetical protein